MRHTRHSNPAWRWAAVLLSLALGLNLSGCQLLPSEDYNDYDVSGYIQAFLDSSYHNSHERFINLSQSSQEEAQLNNTTTVENAAVNFCNAYSLSPSEEQLSELQGIMGQALAAAQYTVMDERRIDTGYYIEVEVTPITSLAGLESDLNQLRTQAQDEADAANAASAPTPAPEEDTGGEDEWGDEYGEEEEPDPTPTPEPTPEPVHVDAKELYVDKVIQLCRERLNQVEYQSTSVTIALDIRQTNEGELQLDMNQIESIDQSVLIFKR